MLCSLNKMQRSTVAPFRHEDRLAADERSAYGAPFRFPLRPRSPPFPPPSSPSSHGLATKVFAIAFPTSAALKTRTSQGAISPTCLLKQKLGFSCHSEGRKKIWARSPQPSAIHTCDAKAREGRGMSQILVCKEAPPRMLEPPTQTCVSESRHVTIQLRWRCPTIQSRDPKPDVSQQSAQCCRHHGQKQTKAAKHVK